MKIDLCGKKALVTGGSGGIGRAIVRTLAECGADVAVHYHSDSANAEKLVKELEAMGRKAAAFRADVTKEDEVNRMRDEMAADFGMPDIVVANAVIQYDRTSLIKQDIKAFYSQYESCVMQMVYLSKAFIPHMQEQHYGRIAVINTECSIAAEPSFSAYVAAKKGLDGLVRVLVKEVGPDNITINQIAPGWTITDKEREKGIEDTPFYDEQVPLRHRGCEQDIANMAAFLVSDLASFVSGAFIPVTGGRVMTAI